MEELINAIALRLQSISGVAALALGGSRARNTHTPNSDIDLGIYYRPEQPLDIAALNRLAAELDDQRRPDLVTQPGGWGPWINGGGWLTVHGVAVDFIYRDLNQVTQVIGDCLAGKVQVDYQPGHPFGFVSSIYLAETDVCRPLWDPSGSLAALKAAVTPYPPRLRAALIQRFFWEADFSLMIARKGAARLDAAYVAGSLFRCVACLAQTLFALNREPWLNEKGALAMAAKFPLVPPDWEARAQGAFTHLQPDPSALQEAIAALDSLVRDVEALVHPQISQITQNR